MTQTLEKHRKDKDMSRSHHTVGFRHVSSCLHVNVPSEAGYIILPGVLLHTNLFLDAECCFDGVQQNGGTG